MTTRGGAHPDRITAAAAAANSAGLDALLITPGADLRYLVGYDALPLERLTCLVVPASGPATLVVPRLEQAAAVASGAGEVVEIVTHEETDDAFALAAGRAFEALGRTPGSVGVADRMWAEQVLRFRSLLPGTAQRIAGEV